MSEQPGYLDRLRSVHVRPQGWSHRIRPVVRTFRGPDGRWVKETLDEAGNIVRERRTGQDVVINLPALAIGWRAVPLLRPGVRR